MSIMVTDPYKMADGSSLSDISPLDKASIRFRFATADIVTSPPVTRITC